MSDEDFDIVEACRAIAGVRSETVFDPLNDDTAAFRLMVKFNAGITINIPRRTVFAWCDFTNAKVEFTNDKKAATRRAICLAVIAAHQPS